MIEFDQNLVEKVRKAGLSEKEARIYTALLLAGGAYPTKVAEITKLNRTTVYKILENLSVRGLITELEKKNKLFYQVENPKNLERHVRTQVTQAHRNLEHAHLLLPTLEGLYAHAENKPIVRFFEGQEGILRVYEDHVNIDKPYEMLAFTNTADLMKFIPDSFRDSYIKKKEKIGITTRAIFPDTQLDKNYNKKIYKNFSEKVWIKFKNIPREMFPYKSDMTLYGEDKVSIINFGEPHLAATIIEDKTIHGMMKMIFELAWVGVEKIEKPNIKIRP